MEELEEKETQGLPEGGAEEGMESKPPQSEAKPPQDELTSEIEKLRKQIEEKEKFIGRQSTEIGMLRQMLQNLYFQQQQLLQQSPVPLSSQVQDELDKIDFKKIEEEGAIDELIKLNKLLVNELKNLKQEKNKLVESYTTEREYTNIKRQLSRQFEDLREVEEIMDGLVANLRPEELHYVRNPQFVVALYDRAKLINQFIRQMQNPQGTQVVNQSIQQPVPQTAPPAPKVGDSGRQRVPQSKDLPALDSEQRKILRGLSTKLGIPEDALKEYLKGGFEW